MLFSHQTIVDSTLLTKLRSSTKHSRYPQWSEDVYISLKTSRDGRHYLSNKGFKPLFLKILGNLANKGFFIKIKVFIGFFRQIKGFKGFHAKYRFLKVLKVPLGGLHDHHSIVMVNQCLRIG